MRCFKEKIFICNSGGISNLKNGERYLLKRENGRDVLVSMEDEELQYDGPLGTLIHHLRRDLSVDIKETRDISIFGDEIVVIREWDDMAESYGAWGSSIPCKATFVSNMRYLCGQTIDLSSVRKDGDYWRIMNSDPSSGKKFWSISTDMMDIVTYNFDFTPFEDLY